MSIFHVLICLIIYAILQIQCDHRLINKIYKNKETKDNVIQFEFIDVNGELNQLIDFEAEIIAEGFGFLEGPKWVNDYLLFTEPKTAPYNIWKYTPKTNKLELFGGKYKGCANGIAWSKQFPDEIWMSCMHGGHKVIHVNITTYDVIDEFDHKTYHIEREAPFQPNDIIMDDKGNVYFTDLPIEIRNNEISARGGVYHINRDTGKMTLIQLMEFAPNGISLNNDQSMIVVANFADVPIEEYDIYNFEQYNWDNMYIVGYKRHPAVDQETALMDQPFYYFKTNEKPFYDYMLHDKYDSYFDGNAFDLNDNLWQSVYFNFASEGGQIIILNNDGSSNDDVKYIGTIRTYDEVYTASNLEQGMDGYMYATAGSFDQNEGALIRYKLKQYKQEL